MMELYRRDVRGSLAAENIRTASGTIVGDPLKSLVMNTNSALLAKLLALLSFKDHGGSHQRFQQDECAGIQIRLSPFRN